MFCHFAIWQGMGGKVRSGAFSEERCSAHTAGVAVQVFARTAIGTLGSGGTGRRWAKVAGKANGREGGEGRRGRRVGSSQPTRGKPVGWWWDGGGVGIKAGKGRRVCVVRRYGGEVVRILRRL